VSRTLSKIASRPLISSLFKNPEVLNEDRRLLHGTEIHTETKKLIMHEVRSFVKLPKTDHPRLLWMYSGSLSCPVVFAIAEALRLHSRLLCLCFSDSVSGGRRTVLDLTVSMAAQCAENLWDGRECVIKALETVGADSSFEDLVAAPIEQLTNILLPREPSSRIILLHSTAGNRVWLEAFLTSHLKQLPGWVKIIVVVAIDQLPNPTSPFSSNVSVWVGNSDIQSTSKEDPYSKYEYAKLLPLQQSWTELRDIVQFHCKADIADSVCIHVAHFIFDECFREEAEKAGSGRILVRWWLEKCVLKIRDDLHVSSQALTPQIMQNVRHLILECGRTFKTALFSDNYDGEMSKRHALASLRHEKDFNQPWSRSKAMFAAVNEVASDAFVQLFDGINCDLLLEAVAVGLFFLRSSRTIGNDSIYITIDIFKQNYRDVTLKDGSNILEGSLTEQWNLWFVFNFMRIASLFIPVELSNHYLQIATGLGEGFPHDAESPKFSSKKEVLLYTIVTATRSLQQESNPQTDKFIKDFITQGTKGMAVSPRQLRTSLGAAKALQPPSRMSYYDSVKDFYNPNNTLKGKVWSPPGLDGEYPCAQFPQIKQKPNFGIAVSGGGLRAAVLCLGWLKALNKAGDGLVTKARYISVNSGGSWITEPLLWWAAINGPKDNEQMTVGEVDHEYQKAIRAAANQHLPGALSQNFGGSAIKNLGWNSMTWIFQSPRNVWSDAVEDIFREALKPNYNDELNDYLNVRDPSVLSSRLPFLIVNGSVVAAHGDCVHFAPFEFTPVYCGIPIDPSILAKEPGNPFVNRGGFTHRSVFDMDYSDNRAVNPHENTVVYIPNKDPRGVKRSEISSISSSAVVEGYYERYVYKSQDQGLLDYHFPVRKHYWAYNAENKSAGENLTGGKVTFADGGSTDNTGILALLRRGVKTIVAFCAIDEDIAKNNNEEKDRSNVAYNKRLLNSMCDYMALFGVDVRDEHGIPYAPSALRDYDAYRDYKAQREVFHAYVWNDLLASLQVQRANGEPLVYNADGITVRENALCGVKAGNANVTFVFNGVSTNCKVVDWDSLNQVGLVSGFNRAVTSIDRLGLAYPYPVTTDFPLIGTEVLHYSADLVTSLSGLAEWSVTEGKVPEIIRSNIECA
jgi:hypothetical protein